MNGPTQRPEQYRDPNYLHSPKTIPQQEAPRTAPSPQEDAKAIIAYLVSMIDPENNVVTIPLEDFESMEYHGREINIQMLPEVASIIVTVV